MKGALLAGLFTSLACPSQAATIHLTGRLDLVQSHLDEARHDPFTPTLTAGDGTAYPLLLGEPLPHDQLALLNHATVTLEGCLTARGFAPTSRTVTIQGDLEPPEPEELRGEPAGSESRLFDLSWTGGHIKVRPTRLPDLALFLASKVALTGTLVVSYEEPFYDHWDQRHYPGVLEATAVHGVDSSDLGFLGTNRARTDRTRTAGPPGPVAAPGGQPR